MADEEKNENEKAPEETPEAEAPEEAAPEAEAPEEAAPEAEETPEPITPKQLRKLERSKHTGEARPPRAPEERAGERTERRAKAAGERRRYRARQRQRRGEPGSGTPRAKREPGSKKVRQGRVVSAKADKTITVRIDIVRRHPQYEKVVRGSATLHAHDAQNQAQEGDTVRVVETRPLSRTKRWRLVEVMERAR